MAKSWAAPFYNSRAWRKCRKAYAESKFFLCEVCGEAGEEVHHKIELTPDNINDPSVTLSWSNLQLLCHACHDKTKRPQRTATRDDVVFDANGQLIQCPKAL